MKKKTGFTISGFEIYIDCKKKNGKFLYQAKFESDKELTIDELGEVISLVLENRIKY